jgi:hypothetical protein
MTVLLLPTREGEGSGMTVLLLPPPSGGRVGVGVGRLLKINGAAR